MENKNKTRGFKGETYSEVVRLSNLGWTRPEIAAALDMSAPTISYHRRKAFVAGHLERYAVRRRPPEPAPAPQSLIIRVPAGVQVEVIQGSPAADLAFAT